MPQPERTPMENWLRSSSDTRSHEKRVQSGRTWGQTWSRDWRIWVLTVFQGAQELGRAPRAIPWGGEAQHWGVVGGEFLQVGDAATVNTVEIRSDGDHGHTVRSIHWPCQELGNLNMDKVSLGVVSIWNQSGFGCQNHLNLIAKKQAMLLNSCQLWCWTDGCSTVTLEGCL